MKLQKIIPLFLLLPAFATMQAKTKEPYKLPAAFNMAQFVWVEAVDGQEFNPRLIPEDRQAIGDVYKALYDWKRYIVVASRDQADLTFVVRTGRLAEAGVGVQAGNGPVVAPGGRAGGPVPVRGPMPGNGVTVEGQVGSPDDLLEVYQRNPNDTHGMLLWKRTEADGLDHPDVPLFKQLKSEIEHDYPVQTASKSSKP